MTEPRILMTGQPDKATRAVVPGPAAAWTLAAWFGLVLALTGLGDYVLALYPLMLGRPEWEFGTVATLFSGLPLVAIGFMVLTSTGIARGQRWLMLAMAAVLLASALLMVGAIVLFLLDVPLVLQGAQSVAQLGLKKLIAKTLMLGVGYVGAFSCGSIVTMRRLRARD